MTKPTWEVGDAAEALRLALRTVIADVMYSPSSAVFFAGFMLILLSRTKVSLPAGTASGTMVRVLFFALISYCAGVSSTPSIFSEPGMSVISSPSSTIGVPAGQSGRTTSFEKTLVSSPSSSRSKSRRTLSTRKFGFL